MRSLPGVLTFLGAASLIASKPAAHLHMFNVVRAQHKRFFSAQSITLQIFLRVLELNGTCVQHKPVQNDGGTFAKYSKCILNPFRELIAPRMCFVFAHHNAMAIWHFCCLSCCFFFVLIRNRICTWIVNVSRATRTDWRITEISFGPARQ